MRWIAAGGALPLVIAIVIVGIDLMASDAVGGRDMVSQVRPIGPVTVTQSESIDLVRRVARRDLMTGGVQIARCGRPRIRCARGPLGRVAFGSRAAAGMLTGIANGLPGGDCRALVLGSGNMLSLLSSDADEMWRALGDRSRLGRQTSALRYASIRELIASTGAMLRGPGWSACRPPRAGAM
jgi:hypothetical protein